MRVKAFDVIKLFAIFLVLWGHSIQCLLSSNYYDEPVYRTIYSFHMPLFMMISGYFSLSSLKLPPLEFLKKKFVQLILPVFSWVIVIGLFQFALNAFHEPSLFALHGTDAVTYIVKGFYAPYPLWFLKTCFICFLLAYCGSHLKINKYLWMIITLVISQRIPHFVNVSVLYPCFLIGIELRDNPKFYCNVCKQYPVWGGDFC